MGDRSPKDKMKKKKQHDAEVQKHNQQKAAKVLQLRREQTPPGTEQAGQQNDQHYKKAG